MEVVGIFGGQLGMVIFGNTLPRLNRPALGDGAGRKALLTFKAFIALVVSTGTILMSRGLTPVKNELAPGCCAVPGTVRAKIKAAPSKSHVARIIRLPLAACQD